MYHQEITNCQRVHKQLSCCVTVRIDKVQQVGPGGETGGSGECRSLPPSVMKQGKLSDCNIFLDLCA